MNKVRLALVLAEISVETLCVLKKGPVPVNVKQRVSARQSCTQVGVRGHSRRAQSSVAGDSVTTARAVPLFRLHICVELHKENVFGHATFCLSSTSSIVFGVNKILWVCGKGAVSIIAVSVRTLSMLQRSWWLPFGFLGQPFCWFLFNFNCCKYGQSLWILWMSFNGLKYHKRIECIWQRHRF